MNGFPKTISTRHDVEVLLESHPEETKRFLATCISEVMQWHPVEMQGLTDDTHKIVEDKDGNKQQYELKEDTNCLLFRLGYTVEEAGAELLDAEGNVIDWKEFIASIENPQPVEEKELTPSDSYAEALATVQAQRSVAYPPIADYLDAIVKGDQNQLDTFIAKCQAVKLKYPKP